MENLFLVFGDYDTGRKICCRVQDLKYFEERNKHCVVYFYDGRSTKVQESFDEVINKVNGLFN